MPAYNFKEQFVPYVANGSKSQTVRAFRTYPVRVGDRAYLYWGLRTKQSRLLRPAQLITDVKCIYISEDCVGILDSHWLVPESRASFLHGLNSLGDAYDSMLGLDLHWLSESEKDEFAWQDGFRWLYESERRDGCYKKMLEFWTKTHDLPFLGQLIKWGE